MKNKAVFLDRDGNINKDVGYPDSFDMIEIYQYSFEAIRKLNKAGLKAVIVTNYCPHYLSSKFPEYDKDCNCRKPKPGLALKAAADLDIDTSRSYMIGDKVEDILFGINISASPILVLTGYGKKSLKTLREKKIVPAYVAQDLLEAVNWILDREQAGK
jgi:D-glycero-D-manno-heptose 1,7-bisphosphate phosphatase